MKRYSATNLATRAIGLAIAATVMACGDSVVDVQELGDLSGTWELTSIVTANTCGLPLGQPETDRLILVSCGDAVSVIVGSGLWGSGTTSGDRLQFSGTEVQDDDGCAATHRSTGSASGAPALLEGTLSTRVTYDPVTDGGHRAQQAYDFIIPVGDTVLAARGGIVRKVKQDSPDDGRGTDHNHVMLEHDDGTVAFYAHLKHDGALVDVGDTVTQGQALALAGHSGTTDIVHLHFGVYDAWPPAEGSDRAVNFRNAQGPLDCRGGLVDGATYTATQ
jgi:hypothetical protein